MKLPRFPRRQPLPTDVLRPNAYPERARESVTSRQPIYDEIAAEYGVGTPDTKLLRDAISDGDHPALRAEVYVTASGSMVHGDLS